MDAALVYSAEPKRHYVGCHLKSVASLKLVSDEPERYALDFRRRRVQFLTSLINSGDERRVYDLRLIAYPDEKVRARGRISLAVLCRIDGLAPAEAFRSGQELLALLDAHFDEYVFELATAEEMKSLLAPFDIQHVAALTRRLSLERLDTLRGGYWRLRPGFLTEDARPEPDRRHDEILHVFPYLPSTSDPLPLFRLLLSQPQPM